MDILALIWILAAVLIFGSYLIFIVPVPTVITIITMVILLVAYRTKKDKKS